jgi:L-aspartate oxidase
MNVQASPSIPQATERTTDFIVVGAGIAGLRAAISLAAHGHVLAITKEQLGESNTSYAQGGIAVAISGAEDIVEHLSDTRAAGDGLVDRESALVLVAEGPARVEELLAWGTDFDRDATSGALLLTREGAHSRNRILHANGDATGAEIGRALLAHARSHPAIELMEWTTCTDLLLNVEGRVCGVALVNRDGQQFTARARAVLLASGGAGQVYSQTTNPSVATGDGIAAAYRAGAAIADMEFYQFHPTALLLPDVPRFLLSEALRGEGAHLINQQGERFMHRYHSLLELAPRDVVARAITRESLPENPGDPLRPVYLDMRHLAAEHPELDLAQRFPGISAFLAQHGLALHCDLLPIGPAAHYLMGGIETDAAGRTSLPGLYAAGEVACTGVHGANRLASNSLLEGLVFGARAAETMLTEQQAISAAERLHTPHDAQPASSDAGARSEHADAIAAIRQTLREEMWRDAGLLRDAAGLERAAACIAKLGQRSMPLLANYAARRDATELRNLLDLSDLIVRSALAREESRGAHYRNDFPQRDDVQFARHSLASGADAVVFEERPV